MVKYSNSDKALKTSGRNLSSLVNEYKAYLDEARTPSQAIRVSSEMLESEGFIKYDQAKEQDGSLSQEIKNAKGIYFIDRNNVNIAALRFGKNKIEEGLNIAGAHVDFCTLTNKVNSMLKKSDGIYLDTRPYGGFYAHQWMDRPLLVIGETLARSKGQRQLVKWEMEGHIPEATIHNPMGYRQTIPVAKAYSEVFKLEDLDVFTGYKDEASFLQALNSVRAGNAKIMKSDFNSGFTQFHVVPAEPTQVLGDYIVGYGHDDRSCMFAALKAICGISNPEYASMALGVAREEIGSTSVGSANDVFLQNVIAALCRIEGCEDSQEIFNKSIMLSADVDIAFNPQNQAVNDKNNCSKFGGGAAIVIANGSDGNPTGNIVMPMDLYFIERFLNKKNLAYQVAALPSKVGIGGGGGTIAKYYSEMGILTADVGIPVGGMHGTLSRIYAADLDSTVQAFKALFERDEERVIWG